ncbi:MAG TPA: pyridine nucleotide-disulfide oxidoreductase, partial [Rubrivivax sp.]|nr:pyridine nucleotide-disulfide oxidoreductase [Rubrivivax sp.]
MATVKRLLLIGAGHAHAQVLQSWIGAPVADVELVVVSPSALAPYSGMVPGWLAGTYRFDEICIDFAALARAAGARLVLDELAALDPARRQLRLAGGATLDY